MKLKQIPEDFVVAEHYTPQSSTSGAYTLFTLTKRGLTTEDALLMLARRLRVPRRRFSHSGNKDKQAVTTQHCSFRGTLSPFTDERLSITISGRARTPISLGDHDGNAFTIVVRDLDADDIRRFRHHYYVLQQMHFQFLNLYDEQRFSSRNVDIGKAIVQKRFADAVDSLVQHHGSYERAASAFLADHPADYVGALRTLPPKILQLYIHAYQSQLWNAVAEQFSGIQERPVLQIPGFGTTFSDAPWDAALVTLLRAEGVTLRDFILRELPHASAEGGSRSLFAHAHHVQVSQPEPDELNPGKQKIVLRFSLGKGSYATLFTRRLFYPM